MRCLILFKGMTTKLYTNYKQYESERPNLSCKSGPIDAGTHTG